jgi:serine/threonine protein kinase
MTNPEITTNAVSRQLSDLLLRWRELRQQGHNPAAEELCTSHPELLNDLQRQIQAVASMERILDLAGGPRMAEEPSETPARMSDPVHMGACPAEPSLLTTRRFALPGYEILDVLGQGGMGIVYKARQVALKRLVALKMILTGPHAQADQLARFRAEAEAVAELRHPNIVAIYEVGEFDDRPYFSMELVEGGTLAQKLAGTPMPARQAARLVGTLAEAVAAAHARGIIHRDLKPANVLLQIADCGLGNDLFSGQSGVRNAQSPSPKIADFGLAKRIPDTPTQVAAGHQTQTGAIVGTASYMAPEQAEGRSRELSTAVDVYALGAILYETLTGRPPFQGETALDTLEQVRGQDPLPPRRLQPKVPRDLETICLECLQKDPRKRYASARALADDLQRFLAGEPVEARPIATWEKFSKWAKRKPALAALLAVSSAAAGSLLGGWVWFTAELHFERENAHREAQRALAQEQIALEQWSRAEEEHARAQALLQRLGTALRDYVDTVKEGKLEAILRDDPGRLPYLLARYCALASSASGQAPELPPADRAKLAKQFADQAVDLLGKAQELRYFRSPRRVTELKRDGAFESLQSRADFQRLQRNLAARRT